jgi:hypothetical protein
MITKVLGKPSTNVKNNFAGTSTSIRKLVRLNHKALQAVKRAGITDGIRLDRYNPAIKNDSSAIL